MTINVTYPCAKLFGFAVLASGVGLAFILSQLLPNQAARLDALRPLAILSDRVIAIARNEIPPAPLDAPAALASAAPPEPAVTFTAGLAPIVAQSPALSEAVTSLTDEVIATWAIKTEVGDPIQEQRGSLTAENYRDFSPREDSMDRAVETAKSLGLRVIRRGRFGLTVGGPAELVSDLIRQPLVIPGTGARKSLGIRAQLRPEFRAAAHFSEDVDNVVFTPPPTYFNAQPDAPPRTFHGVGEADIRRLLNVPDDLDGTGIKVALVDTGFFPHPYYAKRGLSFTPTPTPSSPNADVDDYGHGTAIAYNVFAVAPKVDLLGFKQTNPPQDAVEDAADAGVDIISCSWGWDSEQVFPILQASLLRIVGEGKIILFASGNGHYAWPGTQPEVLSIGGVYWNPAHTLEASNYTSGFMSSLFPERRVPDVCGLCGQLPKAIYMMLPTQPGNTMDRGNAGPTFPDWDTTETDDGWVGISGSSSATPQIAGVVALMVQRAREKGKTLTTDKVRGILEQSAVAITAGRNCMGFPAVGQPNTATGYGLVDAMEAIKLV